MPGPSSSDSPRRSRSGWRAAADACEQVQVEQRIAVGVFRASSCGKCALGGHLRAQRDRLEAVAQLGQHRIFGLRSVALGASRWRMRWPAAATRSVVVLAVAGQRSQARPAVLGVGQPVQVGREPCVQRLQSASLSAAEVARNGIACAISTSGSVSRMPSKRPAAEWLELRGAGIVLRPSTAAIVCGAAAGPQRDPKFRLGAMRVAGSTNQALQLHCGVLGVARSPVSRCAAPARAPPGPVRRERRGAR